MLFSSSDDTSEEIIPSHLRKPSPCRIKINHLSIGKKQIEKAYETRLGMVNFSKNFENRQLNKYNLKTSSQEKVVMTISLVSYNINKGN